MVTADNEEIKIWENREAESYEEKASISLHKNEENVVLTLSEDGTMLAISGTSQRLEIWKRLKERWKRVKTFRLK